MLRIAFVSQPEYFRFSYEDDLLSLGDVREFPFKYHMRKEDFSDLVEFDADFNFFFRGEFFPGEILGQLRGKKINFSSEPFPRYIGKRLEYTRDSIARYLHFRQIRKKAFDYVFHYDEASLPFMEQDGLNLSGAFPFPVAINTYKPQVADKHWDLFFIGRSTAHREKYFGRLKHLHNFLHIAHGIWGPPLIEYIQKTKICLNVHAENETSWEPRMQMLLAAGAFVISEKITPNAVLRPNVDFVEVTSPQELHEAVSYYLANPAERTKIAESGCCRVQTQLDARTNYLRLIHEIDMGNLPRFNVGSQRPSLVLLKAVSDRTHSLRALFRQF